MKKNLVEFFTESAKKYPHHLALVVDDEVVTYQDLLQRASQLASQLSQREERYCVLLTARGIDSYVSLLAILMAEKVYIPLSTKSPMERNLHILNFINTDLIITDKKCMDDAEQLISRYKKHDFDISADTTSDRDAYLLFTSGSTGQPKAVMTSHASAIEYINKMSSYYSITPEDRFTQMTDLTFDVAMHELFLCWANGACLYTITDHQLASLPRFIDQHQLTVWTSVPSIVSLLKQWQRLSPGIFLSIRYSLLLGEPLSEVLAHEWHLAAPHSEIDNLYGPTEATIVFTIYRWKANQPHPSGYVPIGKPLQDQTIAILDENRMPVPIGEVGELFLSGSQVAHEYWRNPDLTREKFIDTDKRWYKTGDYVCWQEPVGLVFKGRDNDFFKVRGGRVERLEVENVLRDIAKTTTVAVIPMPVTSDGVVQGIIAFIGQTTVCDADIIKNCRLRLPEYMTPTKIIHLETLPMNKNGKVDYLRLAEVNAYAID